jgi:class 3 adenylate cyclase
MGESNGRKWIDSKELLHKSDISRATLNNYIRLGIIPRPVVKNPKNLKGTKLGYFPETVLDTITEIKRLKEEGKPMEAIAREVVLLERSAYEGPERRDVVRPHTDQKVSRTSVQLPDGGLRLTLDELTTPAYLLNYQFEIEWINEAAERNIFGKPIRTMRDVELRNVFRLFLSWEFNHFVKNWEEFLNYHMGFYKVKTDRGQLCQLYTGMSGRETEYLEAAYDRAEKMPREKMYRHRVDIEGADGSREKYVVYTTFFREGMFFLYEKAGKAQAGNSEFLSNRETVVRDLLQQRLPTLVSFSVLVADLQNSVRICAELPPEEYFELINSMWRILEESFRRFNGIYGKRIGDGVVYYFLKKQDPEYLMNSINCALAIREKMADFSNQWKTRKRWLNDLHLNMGINEGQEYFSTTAPSSTNIEFTALGDTINYASRLSNLSRFGMILTTKNVMNHLNDDDRKAIRYGITKRSEDRDVFVENVFSRVDDLLRGNETWRQRFADIATLPVTEITDRKMVIPK